MNNSSLLFSYAAGFWQTTCPCTKTLFYDTIRSPKVNEAAEKLVRLQADADAGRLSAEAFKEAKEKVKKGLPGFLFQAKTFQDGRRKAENAVDNGLAMHDYDHLPSPDAVYHTHIEGHEAELGILYVAKSIGGQGLRLVSKRPKGWNIEETQRWMAARLGLEADPAIKDPSRYSFASPESYTYYLHDELFAADMNDLLRPVVSPEELAHIRETDTSTPPKTIHPAVPPMPTGGYDPNNGLLYKEFIPYNLIISKWWELHGGEPREGERHTKLTALAAHLAGICDNDNTTMQKILPSYGLPPEEVWGIVCACTNNPRTYISKSMQRAVDMALAELQGTEGGYPIPSLPRRLPSLLKLLTSCTPAKYKETVLNAVFPALATYLYDISFELFNGERKEATLMCLCIAPQSAGKSCYKEVNDAILSRIDQQDEGGIEEVARWKEAESCKSANQKHQPRPRPLKQHISSNTTNAALVNSLLNAQGHFLYVDVNEFENMKMLAGSWTELFNILKLSWDTAYYGQERVSREAVEGRAKLRLNWNASTTPAKALHFLRNNLTDGVLTRLLICSLPAREIGEKRPAYKHLDADFHQQLAPYIERLAQAQGDGERVIRCPQIKRKAEALEEWAKAEAVARQDSLFETFAIRANTLVTLQGYVLYAANGCRWEKAIGDFMEWSFRYDLAIKIHLFGKAIEEAMQLENSLAQPSPKPNMLLKLPNAFTRQHLVQVYLQLGKNPSPKQLNDLLYQWIKRGHIQQTGEENYEKLRFKTNENTEKTNNNGNDINPNHKA